MTKKKKAKEHPQIEALQRTLEDVRNIKIDTDKAVKAVELKRQRKFFQSSKKHRKLGWWSRRKLAKKPEQSYLITMWFANGTEKTWVIATKKNTFTSRGKMYYIFYEESNFDISMNQYHLYYHENYAVPVNREVIKTGDEAFFNVTPDNLSSLIKFEYVKVLASAQSLNKTLKFVLLIVFINILISLFQLLRGL